MTGAAVLTAPLPEDVDDALPLALAAPAVLLVEAIMLLALLVADIEPLFLVVGSAALAFRKFAQAMAAVNRVSVLLMSSPQACVTAQMEAGTTYHQCRPQSRCCLCPRKT